MLMLNVQPEVICRIRPVSTINVLARPTDRLECTLLGAGVVRKVLHPQPGRPSPTANRPGESRVFQALPQHDTVDHTGADALRGQAVLVVHEALVQLRWRPRCVDLKLIRGALAMIRHDPPLLVVGVQLTGVVENRPVPVQVIRRGPPSPGVRHPSALHVNLAKT
jgi:hypothetical protein